MMNNTGLKIEPCGTPERITSSEELWLFNLTNCHFQIASNIQCYTELDSLSFQLNYGSYCIRHLLTKLLKSLRNIWNINGTTAVYRRLQQIIMCLYSITYSLSESCSPTGLMVQLFWTRLFNIHRTKYNLLNVPEPACTTSSKRNTVSPARKTAAGTVEIKWNVTTQLQF